jgi:hypothetical protein
MANTDKPNGFTWIKNLDGSGIQTIEVTIKSTVAIAKGDALIVDAGTGNADIALSNSGAIFAVANASVTAAATSRTIPVVLATPNAVFEAQCNGTYSAGVRFTAVDIEGTTGVMEVNENATTEQVFQVLGEDPNTEIGANSRVFGVFIRSEAIPLLAAL